MLNFSFPKTKRILRRWQYSQLVRHGILLKGEYIIIQKRSLLPHEPSGIKLGITVSRSFGKAHKRNRFKRSVREAFRLNYKDLPQNCHINIKPGPLAHTATPSHITNELFHFLSEDIHVSICRTCP